MPATKIAEGRMGEAHLIKSGPPPLFLPTRSGSDNPRPLRFYTWDPAVVTSGPRTRSSPRVHVHGETRVERTHWIKEVGQHPRVGKGRAHAGCAQCAVLHQAMLACLPVCLPCCLPASLTASLPPSLLPCLPPCKWSMGAGGKGSAEAGKQGSRAWSSEEKGPCDGARGARRRSRSVFALEVVHARSFEPVSLGPRWADEGPGSGQGPEF